MLTFIKDNRIGLLDRMSGLDTGKLSQLLDGIKAGTLCELIIKPVWEPKSNDQIKAWYRGVGLALQYMAQNDCNISIDYRGKAFELPLTKESVDLFLKQRVALPLLGYIPSKADMKRDDFARVLDRLDQWLKKYMNINLFEVKGIDNEQAV